MTYNPNTRHQGNTKSFEELNFKEQALSINGQIASLRMAVRAHLRRAEAKGKSPRAVRQKCVGQVERLLERIKSI